MSFVPSNELISRMSRVAFAYTRNDADADDAVQESMIRLLGADLADVENLESFAIQQVKFSALNVLRRRRAKRETEIPETFEPAAKSTIPVDIDWILESEKLDETDKRIVVMLLNGNKQCEIAIDLRVTKSTISERVRRIQAALQN